MRRHSLGVWVISQPPNAGSCLPLFEPSHGKGSGRFGPFHIGRGREGGPGGGGGGAVVGSRSNLRSGERGQLRQLGEIVDGNFTRASCLEPKHSYERQR